MLGMLLAALDQTIVSTALPTIVGDLKGGLPHRLGHYRLPARHHGVHPAVGQAGRPVRPEDLFQAAIVIFLVGSILSGLSNSMISSSRSARFRGSAPAA